MKIFQGIQKKLAIIGFSPNQQQNNSRIFGVLQSLEIAIGVLCTGLIVLYFLRIANSKEEYMYSGFVLTIAIVISLCQSSLKFKNDKMFNMIDFGEKLVTEIGEFQVFHYNY